VKKQAFLRFDGAVRHDAAIDAWFSKDPGELRSIAKTWFDRMRACGDDVRELMHDGAPTACIGDAAFGYVNVYTAHVNVGFFQGASLPDPRRLLQGDGKFMRHVKLKPGLEVDGAALEALILAGYRNLRKKLS